MIVFRILLRSEQSIPPLYIESTGAMYCSLLKAKFAGEFTVILTDTFI
jgi:hypothetical protein